MIINNNITALHSLKISTEKHRAKGAVSEKLASGLRINKAADDAAGLAISEKMRAQIRGLKQAQRNIQDGISLIQTAEGGLSSILNPPLQRLRELAVQASNDTLTNSDRMEIQKEVDQLKQSVDEIANNTHFNGIHLLNGTSIKTNTEVIREVGVEWEVIQSGTTDFISGVSSINGQYIAVGENGNLITSSDGDTWNISNIGTQNNLYNLTSNGTQIIVFGDNGSLYTSNDGVNWSNQTFPTDGIWNPSQLQLHDGLWDGSRYVIAADRGHMITSNDGINWSYSKTGTTQNRGIAYNGSLYITIGSGGTIFSSNDTSTWVSQVSNTTNELNSITWHNDRFIAVGQDGTVLTSQDGENWDYHSLDATRLDSIISTGDKVFAVGYDTAGSKNIFTSGDGLNWNSNETMGGEIILDITYNSSQDELLAVTYDGEILRSKSLTQDTKKEVHNSLNFQIGSNAQQSLTIELSDVRTSSLGIEHVNLSNREGAEMAINVIDKAIKKVSTERSYLGTHQNRLEHALNNASNYETNLTSAESRIRDVDIAKQSMESVKLDILQQSSQVILAQANQQPENILKLLV